MKGNPVLYKFLVVGVIILFIGIGIQPAIALNESTSISDDEDECNLCPKVSKSHIVRIKGLIDRLDTLDTRLSKVSKLNPELEEKYQELSENIMSLKELNKYLDPDKPMDDYPYPIICTILVTLAFSLFNFYYELFIDIWAGYFLWMCILSPVVVFLVTGWLIGCWDWTPYSISSTIR